MPIAHLLPKQTSLLPTLVLIILFTTLHAACSPVMQTGTPAMPRGFAEARIPDIDLNGYIYVAQNEPIPMTVNRFSIAQSIDSVEEFVSINHMLAWVGPTGDDFGSNIQFTLESSAKLVSHHLDERHDEDSVWHMIDGTEIRLVRSPSPWATDARQSLENERMSLLEQHSHSVWEMMQLLPGDPPVHPVSAGFVRNTPTLIQSLTGKVGIHDQSISSALGSLYLGSIAFAIYSNQPITLPTEINREYFQQLDAGVIAVAQSGYPGFAVSFLFGTFAGRTGLQKVDISGTHVYHQTLDYLHIYLTHIGNVFFFTASGNRATAEALMSSVLTTHASKK